MQYTVIFHSCKNDNFQMKNSDIFLIFAQNIDSEYTLAVLTSTHDLCFRAKIIFFVYTCKPQFYYIKVGCKGVYIIRTCYPDAYMKFQNDISYIHIHTRTSRNQ